MRQFLRLFLFCLTFVGGLAVAASAENADDLIKAATAALKDGKPDEALTLASKAVALDPKNVRAHVFRGSVHGVLRRHKEAIADFTKAIELDPKAAEAYNRRGGEHFKLGRIAESIADFDKFLELRPDAIPGHWQRGISYYYAGRFEDGAKQFGAYEKVDTNDVENAVWHFICTARASGIDKARASMLKIGKDKRVPMMQVYDLFLGKLKPEDVMAAAQEGKPPAAELKHRMFYAHLYLGIYYDITGDRKKALEHITKAADEEYQVGGYMWDVARVHREHLGKEAKPKP